MEPWMKMSLMLCVFGFLKEFRPSEPFVTPFLTTFKNFTLEEVNQRVFPVETYSWLSLLVVVFLITDMVRYKPVIIVLALSGVATWSLFIWGTNIAAMQAAEFWFGMFLASEVAYFTYIYAQVEKEHYQAVTSHIRTAFLLGRFLSSSVCQALISSGLTSYSELNYLTLVAEIMLAIWAFLLPSVKHSLYFHRREDSSAVLENNVASAINNSSSDISSGQNSRPEGIRELFLMACTYLWQDFKQAFTNPLVVKWSMWWALGTCGYLQAIIYSQNLWEDIVDEIKEKTGETQELYNGAVEAIYTLVGAAAAFACGWLKLDWAVYGEPILALCSLLQGITLLVSSYASSLWLAYAMYITFVVFYQTMITIANSEVAKNINEDSYGLIFGVNTFFALLCQTILTFIVVGEHGLALSSRLQYEVYGGYFLAMGGLFLIMALYNVCCRRPLKTWIFDPLPAAQTSSVKS
ncbi:thiamine transporter 2 isoform X2 [Anabrus simplex]